MTSLTVEDLPISIAQLKQAVGFIAFSAQSKRSRIDTMGSSPRRKFLEEVHGTLLTAPDSRRLDMDSGNRY